MESDYIWVHEEGMEEFEITMLLAHPRGIFVG
jgi:hypothetical protein